MKIFNFLKVATLSCLIIILTGCGGGQILTKPSEVADLSIFSTVHPQDVQEDGSVRSRVSETQKGCLITGASLAGAGAIAGVVTGGIGAGAGAGIGAVSGCVIGGGIGFIYDRNREPKVVALMQARMTAKKVPLKTDVAPNNTEIIISQSERNFFMNQEQRQSGFDQRYSQYTQHQQPSMEYIERRKAEMGDTIFDGIPSVYFEIGMAKVEHKYTPQLKKFVAVARAYPSHVIILYANTDQSGTEHNNFILALMRGNNVKASLEEYGTFNQIIVKVLGEESPMHSYAASRRVEIELIPPYQEPLGPSYYRSKQRR